MANDNNIKNFTAADIEKYHLGQLSAKEMHVLEKAALDDPFLADALEGYAVTGINVNADISDLKKRLAEKTEQAKVIPMQQGGRSSFPWLRAAVMVLLIAGAGTLAYQFLFKSASKDERIAQSPAVEKKNSTEPVKTLPRSKNDDSTLNDAVTEKSLDTKTPTENEIKQQQDVAKNLDTDDKSLKDSVTTNPGIAVTDASASKSTPKIGEEKTDSYKLEEVAKRKMYDSTGKSDIAVKNLALNKKATERDADGVAGYYDKSKGEIVSNGAVNRRNDDNLYRNTNVFRGRVTDASNNALPFTNVTNSRDNVGTYSDAQGNFTLVSTDTVLNVQVRSLGFQNSNVQLRNYSGLTDNKVVMQEDRSLNAKILDTVKRNVGSRARNNTMTFEEPEPEDGWDSYGSYVINNLNIPETFDMKKGGETIDNSVEVSFEVNKNGEPVNIRVEKSLCDKCDKEAIRLIKEGPKWKRKAKKSKRTTVTVPFIKTE